MKMDYVDRLAEFAYYAAKHYASTGALTDAERSKAIIAREIAPEEYFLECFETLPIVDALRKLGDFADD